jgi:hypothetical protein
VNISRLKELLARLPDSIDPTTLTNELATELCDEFEEIGGTLKEVRRLADIQELQEALAKVATLQTKLGQVAPLRPSQVNPPSQQAERDLTDSDMGIGYDDDTVTATSFRAELTSLRDYNIDKRRRHQ